MMLMPFPKPVVIAEFLRRPQRFLAEISFPNGVREIAYCANPGAFNGCLNSGSKVILWDSNDLKRKRRYTLRAISPDPSLSVMNESKLTF